MKYWKIIIGCTIIGFTHSSCSILGTYSSRSYSIEEPSIDKIDEPINSDSGKPPKYVDQIKIKRNHKVELILGFLPITREGVWKKENDTLIINYPEPLPTNVYALTEYVYIIDGKKLISISDSTVFFKN